MKTDQIHETIQSSYENGYRDIEIEGRKIILLPYAESLPGYKSDNEVVVYKDLFDKKPEFFVSQISFLLGRGNTISESETVIREIRREVFDKFCNEHHFNRGTNSKMRFGLFYQSKLVMVAGFSKPKQSYKDNQKINKAELYRVVQSHEFRITKGLEKLVQYFIQEFNIQELLAVVDNEFDDLSIYLDLGFEIKEEIAPSFSWLFLETNERFTSGQLVKKNLLRKENLNQMVHPPKGYLPIQNMGHSELVLIKD